MTNVSFVGMGDFIQDKLDGMPIDKVLDRLLDLGVSADDVSDILENMGFKTKDVAEATKKLSSAAGAGTAATGKLGTAFSGLAAKIGISTTALGTLVGVLAVVGVAFAAFKIYDSYIQRYVDSAKEAGSAWDSFNASSESQIDRIKELDDALKSGTLSETECIYKASRQWCIYESTIYKRCLGIWFGTMDLVHKKNRSLRLC